LLLMRIMLFTSQIMNTFNYIRAFAGIDHEFVVVILVPRQRRKQFEDAASKLDDVPRPNIVVIPIFLASSNENLRNFLNIRNFAHDVVAVARTIRNYRPDLAIGMFVIHAYPLVILSRVYGFSLYVVVSGGDLYLHNEIWWKIIRKVVYANTKIIFTVGDELKRMIEEESGHIPEVIRTGTDPNYYRPLKDVSLRERYGFSSSDLIVLTLCQLIDRKGVDDVMMAVRHLAERHRTMKMIVAGDGPIKPKLMKMASDLGLNEIMHFTGLVDEKTKRDLFNVTNAYVLASYAEGLPFSLLEAMSCECICIASNVGDVPRVIRDSINGFMITPGDHKRLAKRIEFAINLPDSAISAIGKRARQTIVERYNFQKSIKRMIELMQS